MRDALKKWDELARKVYFLWEADSRSKEVFLGLGDILWAHKCKCGARLYAEETETLDAIVNSFLYGQTVNMDRVLPVLRACRDELEYYDTCQSCRRASKP